MSWFSKALDTVKKVGKQIVSDVAGGLDLLSSVFVAPRETAAAFISRDPAKVVAVVEKVKEKPKKETITKTAVNTLIAGAAIAVAPSALAIPAVKGVVTSAALGAGTLAVLAPETTSKILSSEALTKTAAAGLVAGPAGALIVGAEEGVSIVGSILEEIPDKLKTPALVAGAAVVAGAGAYVASQLLPDKAEAVLNSDGKTAILPQTSTITTGVKRRKRAKKPQITSINQNVRVSVQNSARSSGMRIMSERYLNKRAFAY